MAAFTNFPLDTDLVYVDDPETREPHPLRGKITQWWADALRTSQPETTVIFRPVNDCVKGTRGSITIGLKVLTIAAPDTPFTQGLVGKPISIFGAGPTVYAKNSVVGSPVALAAGDILVTRVVSVAADGLSLTVVDAAVATVTDAQWAAGTDNTPGFNAAMAELRALPGGLLQFDPNSSGDCFFATVGWVGVFGDNYVDRVDFDNCHVDQGSHNIVMGAPMGLLEVNQSVFNNWAVDADRPPICDITAPVAKGAFIIDVDPAQMVDGSGNPLFRRDDYILIFSGYIGTFYFGFNLPDAQICQIVFADIPNSQIILAEPTLKPFVQEVYPVWTGGTAPPTSGTNAPFGIMNVTDILIHNFRYTNLRVETFFFTDLLTGGQCSGMYIDQGKMLTRGTWHSMNYVRRGITSGIKAFIDNLNSPRLDFDYAFTFAVGSSQVIFKDSEINSTGTTYLHIHEGQADCKVDKVTLGNFNGNPNLFGIQPVSVRGRSYDLKVTNCNFTGWDTVGVVYIQDDCTDGGLFWNCTVNGRSGAFVSRDVECYGASWRLDFPNISRDRVYQKSTNIEPTILRASDPILNSVEALTGFTSALGGLGTNGNLLYPSDDLTGIPWNAAAGVTVTANTGDITDPLGTNTASKVVTGATSANMEVSNLQPTPAAGVVTGVGNNANRSFKLVFDIYSLIENEMEFFLGSFVPGPGLDLTNTTVRKVAVYPQWQRVEVVADFGASAVTGTELLAGVASAVTAPVVGLNSTFYIWGVTVQEVFGPTPVVTRTTAARVAYSFGFSVVGRALLPVLSGTLSPDTRPTLGTTDAGIEFEATDYKHRFRWTGAAWEFAPGDPGSKYIVAGIAAPLGGLWGLCDGTAYQVANDNGTLSSVTTPNLTGDVFIQGGNYTGTIKAETRAKWEAGAKTADEAAHTHSVHVVGNNNYAAGANGAVADQSVTSGAGSAHSHNLTDALSQLKKPTEADGGLPPRIDLAWYMRR